MTDQQPDKGDLVQNNGSGNGRASIRPGRRAIFLDRDGTITEEVGYVNHITRAQVFPWAPEAIRKLKAVGLPVIVLTNQSGVGRGYFSEELVAQVHRKVQDELMAEGTKVDAFFYCPHHPNATLEAFRMDCQCRKPSTGMADEAAEQFGIDFGASYVVGDTYRDMRLGFNIGARTILLMTGYGRGEYEHHRSRWPRMPDLVAENLLEAAELVLQELNSSANAGTLSRSSFS